MRRCCKDQKICDSSIQTCKILARSCKLCFVLFFHVFCFLQIMQVYHMRVALMREAHAPECLTLIQCFGYYDYDIVMCVYIYIYIYILYLHLYLYLDFMFIFILHYMYIYVYTYIISIFMFIFILYCYGSKLGTPMIRGLILNRDLNLWSSRSLILTHTHMLMFCLCVCLNYKL